MHLGVSKTWGAGAVLECAQHLAIILEAKFGEITEKKIKYQT